MDINETIKCNFYNLKTVSNFLSIAESALSDYYRELQSDNEFLQKINSQIEYVRNRWGFNKAIFGKQIIESIDWFAFQRVLLYVLIRHLKPKLVLETGVYYGGNSAFILRALEKNGFGKLISIDYPDYDIRSNGTSEDRHSLVGDTELYTSDLKPGFMIPESIKAQWELIEGDSLKIIPSLDKKFEFYIHDSDHSMPFLSRELRYAWEKLTDDALVLVDDIDWSNAFYEFCVSKRLYPLLLTDNGKDNLRVRNGLVKRDHYRNGDRLFT